MRRFDTDPNILEWSSEECVVAYTCKTDGRFHRYFPDFIIKARQKDGSVKTIMIEYKPYTQTLEPVPGNKTKKSFLYESMTYAKNISKWDAAERYCKKKGWYFKILTEKDIGAF